MIVCSSPAVRRVSPMSILGDAVLSWVRADRGLTLAGDTLVSWADQSGNGNDWTAGGSPQRNATGNPAGGPVITFRTGWSSDKITAAFSAVQPFHVIVAGRWTRAAGVQQVLLQRGSGSSSYVRGNNDPAPIEVYAGGAGFNGPTWADTTWHVLDVLFSGASSRAALDDGVADTGNPGVNGCALPQMFVNGWGFDCTELVWLSRAATSGELTDLISYMRDWTGI